MKIILGDIDLVEIIAKLLQNCCKFDKMWLKLKHNIYKHMNCCSLGSKINPIKELKIMRISKNNQNIDLMINCNDIYNQNNDENKISLKKVLE